MRLPALLATVAALLLPDLAHAADARWLTGHWVGTYSCEQGKMGLVLDLTGAPEGTVTGTFAFAPTKGSGPRAATGRYSLKGTVSESGLFFLEPDAWIEQPEGYEMVGLFGFGGFGGMGRVDGFSGQIKSPACGKYEVERARG